MSALVLALGAAACNDEPSASASGGGGAGGAPASGAGGGRGTGGAGGSGGGGATDGAIDWKACALSTDDPTGSEAECAEIPVPVRWDDPSAGTITFFVKRLLGARQPSRLSLWLLNGGPGYSGADFEGFARAVTAADPTVDVYMPDHRGVGRSSRLSCPEAEADSSAEGFSVTDDEVPACIDHLKAEWGDKLAGFTMTNAARDVGETIARTRAPGSQVVVYGASYGTDWAHRYMQIYPDQPTGVVLDAIAVNASLSDMDVWFNDLGREYMNRCGADALCSSKLGADPWAAMTRTLDDADGGSCPEVAALGLDRPTLHLIFSSAFYAWDTRPVVPAMVYRLARCSAADVNAFAHLAGLLAEPTPAAPSQRLFSDMLSRHITLSELWPSPPPSLADIEAFAASANVAHFVPTAFARSYDAWPRYPRDAYAGPLADFGGPVLMLRGELDFIPMAVNDPVRAQYAGPHQTFVLVRRAPHGSLQSPVPPNGASCGGHLLKQFVDDPTATLDTSCAERVAPLSFDGPELASAYFGTPDLWEGDPGAARTAARALPKAAALEAAAARIARAALETRATGTSRPESRP